MNSALFIPASLATWFADVKETFVFCFIEKKRYTFLTEGIWMTIKVSLVAALFGLVIGFVIAIFNLSNKKALNKIGKVYTDILEDRHFEIDGESAFPALALVKGIYESSRTGQWFTLPKV